MKKIAPIELGIAGSGTAYRNLAPAQLVEAALRRGEGTLSETGALVVKTGRYTGRSPDDKFIVDTPAVHDEIAWGKINVPIEKAKFDAIKAKILAYLQNKEIFVFDGFAGADPKYTKRFRIINELASQNLFIHQLLIRPTDEQLDDYVPDYTIYAAPGFKCIPEVDGVHSEAAIIIDYEAHEVLICGTGYAGEIKKSVFSVMNYVLPKEGILSMHCSANIGDDGNSAVFFGLSGTGKTTLSADPNRKLIGDDEHGWSADGVFNSKYQSAVTYGYAKAFKAIMDYVGVPCLYIEGQNSDLLDDSMDTQKQLKEESYINNCAWNAVYLGGEWYLINLGLDDPITTTGKEALSYTYFNVTDEQASNLTAITSRLPGIPKCTGTKYCLSKVQADLEADGLWDKSSYNIIDKILDKYGLSVVLISIGLILLLVVMLIKNIHKSRSKKKKEKVKKTKTTVVDNSELDAELRKPPIS